MAIRYNSITRKDRPNQNTWKELKKWISNQSIPSDNTLPPIFGYVCDSLRDKYKIYISVTPHQRTESKDEDGQVKSSLVFHFAGEIVVMESIGVITDSMTYTGTDYYSVMSKCLEWAIQYLNNSKNKNNNGTSK